MKRFQKALGWMYRSLKRLYRTLKRFVILEEIAEILEEVLLLSRRNHGFLKLLWVMGDEVETMKRCLDLEVFVGVAQI